MRTVKNLTLLIGLIYIIGGGILYIQMRNEKLIIHYSSYISDSKGNKVVASHNVDAGDYRNPIPVDAGDYRDEIQEILVPFCIIEIIYWQIKYPVDSPYPYPYSY